MRWITFPNNMNVCLRLLVLGLCILNASSVRAEEAPKSAGFSCGLNAAYIFLNRAGHHVGYDELVTEFETQSFPDSLLAIKNILGKHGCKVVGVKADASFFLGKNEPAIVYLQLSGFSTKNENHFSYMVGASRQEGVELLDPVFVLRGASYITWDSFVRAYQGIALIAHE
jgi:ABC-type bacteriocin/lantibiotic exporter with double-glycine peptidase domain